MLAIAVKAMFWLSLASARWVSKIHMLSVEGVIRCSDSCLPQPSFLTINQCPSVTPVLLLVHCLATFCWNDSTDMLQCPIRALRVYLSRLKTGGVGGCLFLPIEGSVTFLRTLNVRAFWPHCRSKPTKWELVPCLFLASSQWAPLQDLMRATYGTFTRHSPTSTCGLWLLSRTLCPSAASNCADRCTNRELPYMYE